MDYSDNKDAAAPAPSPDGDRGGLLGVAGSMGARLKSLLPDVGELYLEPLDPGSGLPLPDRASLVMQSIRPWGEFLDVSAFNRPTLEEANKRVGHNVRTYFYNYFLLACVHILVFSFGHFGTVLAVLLWAALAWFLYGYRPEDIDVFGKFTLDGRAKLILVILTGALVIFLGHVLTLVISLAVFLLIVVGVHSLVRDNTMDAIEQVI